MTYLVIEENKKNPNTKIPAQYNTKYGLVNAENGKVLLPVEFSSIIVKEEGGFVWTERFNEETFSCTYEVYEILGNGELKKVDEEETTEFEWGIYGTDFKVLKIDGRIRLLKTMNKCIS